MSQFLINDVWYDAATGKPADALADNDLKAQLEAAQARIAELEAELRERKEAAPKPKGK